MKLLRAVLGVLVGGGLAAAGHAVEMTWTYAVLLSAKVGTDPARIELNWTTDPFPVRHYTIHRKALGDAGWGEPIAVLAPDTTSYVDERVEAGKVYEYEVARQGLTYASYGYLAVGLQAPVIDSRGRIVLVVDRTVAEPLAAELKRLEADLVGDGWTVVRRDVARDAAPAEVKATIKAVWEADKERTRALLLFGHVPVVRSGNQNVDGHQARPMPADVFYGELDGEWTDVDGDGIYDQSTLTSDVELMIGRVDFADLPGQYSPVPYPNEVDLLRRYLDKDHAFRHAAIRPKARALVGNAIGDGNGQAYAASGYRNFAALLGAENIVTTKSDYGTLVEERWMSRLSADDYLFAYACGAGSDTSIGAMGSHGMWGDAWSSDFIEKKAKGMFYLMFGSWFADWAKPDNVMRSALSGPEYGLAAAFSGRPHIFYHHMGVGEPIGHGMRVSQNNNGLLYKNQVQRQLRGVHIALMGDPTLRLHQVAPARDVVARPEGGNVVVSWTESRDTVLGYHVYRAASANGPFTRLTDGLATETRFVDTRRTAEAATYMVRAVALVTSPSGTYHHASQGLTATVEPTAQALVVRPEDPSASSLKASDVVWFDDALPIGAVAYASENDRWNWVAANPLPFSGMLAHQSEAASGLHHHFFAFPTTPLTVAAGDTLFAYVFLDPNNPPREVMLTWLAGDWEHRAYWGENLIGEGVDGSAARRYMGPLPSTNRWVRLEVPASAVNLENQSVTGMGFTLYNGRATWDRAGKSRP